MNKEFFVALDLLEKEKGIPKDYMLEKIEAALLSACRKEYGASTLVRVHIDPVKEDMKVFIQKEVVEEVTNPQCQISLEEAKAMSDWSLAEAKKIRDDFCATVSNCENEETLKLLKDVQYRIMEKSIREEMYRTE